MSAGSGIEAPPPPGAEEGGELRMSLGEHLGELRSRLFRCVVAVLVLGGASLAFAKPIFGFLMRPVLQALPPESRSLIYTSGIEELNVLMKVGLYCGIFLATPVVLWQLWGFVSPGLYEKERKLAGPFVILGTIAFLTGAAFCYTVLLPTMFQFLLREGDAKGQEERLEVVRLHETEALRWLRIGDGARAAEVARSAGAELASSGFQGAYGGQAVSGKVDLTRRLLALGELMDALTFAPTAATDRELVRVMDARQKAIAAFAQDDFTAAAAALDEAASGLDAALPARGAQVAAVWTLQKSLARAQAVHHAQAWTRPMLTMREQLSLVLLLELAFGIIFELPLVMALLASVGLVSAGFLMRYQRHAFVVCLIGAAIITPTGDAVNLAMMAVPMMLCYELGVLAVWMIEKRRKAALAAEGVTLD